MKLILFTIVCVVLMVESVPQDAENREELLHFDFKTENGQVRTEDIKYNNTNEISHKEEDGPSTPKNVEYRGGYSFISADGYEYTVKYKANKKGFQPYVTARKIQDDKSKATTA